MSPHVFWGVWELTSPDTQVLVWLYILDQYRSLIVVNAHLYRGVSFPGMLCFFFLKHAHTMQTHIHTHIPFPNPPTPNTHRHSMRSCCVNDTIACLSYRANNTQIGGRTLHNGTYVIVYIYQPSCLQLYVFCVILVGIQMSLKTFCAI